MKSRLRYPKGLIAHSGSLHLEAYRLWHLTASGFVGLLGFCLVCYYGYIGGLIGFYRGYIGVMEKRMEATI